ncbi:hypothetical protein I305_05619 [Cryptococcus gattii E566]|uniref:Uncharacterized protein n=2 Tax=Cryptococcus gattii TaxID=37769 RepID=E6R928_CRYGW|nr:Hypothetical Protein CGB_G1310C [Cryptococcus gattii WM276]ADV23351.1 Hypothetical Protein CGB_G1310C [Cryptococcus gattii WM276]KIR77898.1 hypothetical protein I306_05136 [Cryptococcus gattii EJB2]KIY31981.1 hypothetical protein I305_05619 [Cryptococcus gattii E566]KJE03247.1 hypothetical protein I311_03070 [Cryptococcus gattii NT-10]
MSWRTSPAHSYKFPTTISLRTTLTAPQLAKDARDKDLSQFFETPGLSSKELTDDHQAHSLPAICDALATPLLSTLLPFTRLPANTYFPSREPPPPTSLLPNSLLSALTRNQLIDALVRLGKDDRLISKKIRYEQELVLELCLEYIGRRWRSSEAVAESVVDDISRKLTKVEFETRIRGYPPVVRTIISPILHKVRFVLGFVTSSQLVTRLNSSDRSTYLHSDSRPHQNITSWIERRLQAGMAYPFILEECKTMKQGVSDENGDTIMDVLEQFGLAQSFIDGDYSSYHLVRKSSHSPSLRPKLSPKWFSHKRAHSSLSKVDCLNPYQQPSLSAIHSHNGSATLSRIPYSNSSHSSSSSSLAPGDDVYTFLGCANISEARSVLLWRLLDMRYHGLEQGWFLGGRREQAEAMLDSLERDIVNDLPLRVLFHFLRLTFHLQLAPTAASKPDVSSNWLSGGTFHARDVSFDLEQYLRDISQPIQIVDDDEEDGKQVESHYRSRCSTPATMPSVWTSESQIDDLGRRASSVSTFTIKQAVRRDTIKTRAIEFSFPKKEVKMPKEDQRQSKWTACSVSNFKKEPSYIRLPTKFGLRRSTKLTNSADQLAEGLHIDTSVPLSSQPSHSSPTPSTTTTLVQSSLYQNGSLPNSPTLRNLPLGQNRRQLHRQCAILDGERLGPSKFPDFHSSGEISPAATSFRSNQFARMNPFQVESSILEDHGHSSGLSPITSYQDCSPVPLSSILKLFWDLPNGRQLEPEEVEDALMRFVASERRSVEDKGDNWDEGARCRVGLSG